MTQPLRVLMIQPSTGGLNYIAERVNLQTDSLKTSGILADTYVFENRRSLRGLVVGGREIRRRAFESRADLVHVHYGAAQALIAVLFSPKPVVISFCGSDLLGNYNSHARKTWSGYLSVFLSQLAALFACRCLAKTDELRQALWLASCRSKCEVIPNGVDLDQFQLWPRSEARAGLKWLHDDPVALFIDRKGAWVKDPELARAAYEEAIKLLPSLRMHVVETEPPERMPLFYNAADVLLVTSRHEGSNNTVKEAMACNLPVVATACGDIPGRLREVSPSYICSRDPGELGRRLAEIVNIGKRSNGRKHILDLSTDRVAHRVIEFYERGLDRSLHRTQNTPPVGNEL